jgi:uracil-DNA glycosylase
MSDSLAELVTAISRCQLCADQLPHGPRPVVQIHPNATVLIAAQAPGRRVHDTGIPFNDPSGERLRDWMGIGKDTFYDPQHIAIVPMGFCYPGKGKSGDLPPIPRCAATWRQPALDHLGQLRLTLVIGQYAQRWHLPRPQSSLTKTVLDWRSHLPGVIPLPHPSPRNNLWLNRNPWFEAELVPVLRERVKTALS